MKRGCKYCAYNGYDGVNLGSNICDKYYTHINVYSERRCDGFEPNQIAMTVDAMLSEMTDEQCAQILEGSQYVCSGRRNGKILTQAVYDVALARAIKKLRGE